MLNETVSDISNSILSVKEIAKLMGVHERTIYRLAHEGKMPGFKFGGQWRFDREIIQQWMATEMYKKLEAKRGNL